MIKHTPGLGHLYTGTAYHDYLTEHICFSKVPYALPIHLSFPTKLLRPLVILLPTVYQTFSDWLLSLSNVQFGSLQAFDGLFVCLF